MLQALYQHNCSRYYDFSSSLLRRYSIANASAIAAKCDEHEKRKEMRLRIVTDLKESNYTKVYTKMLLHRFQLEHGIPEVNITGQYNTAYVMLPRMKNNQFVVDTNLECFEPVDDYYSEDDLQSYCVNHNICSGSSLDLINLARTFKDLSRDPSSVWILTDSNKIALGYETYDSSYYIRMSFVRRDREVFNLSQYKVCRTIIQEYLREKPGFEVRLAFEGKWLTDELIVIIEAPLKLKTRLEIRNIVEDIAQRINLIKGLIFAKIVDQIKWIELH
jgi:hypothetical protein